MKRCVLHAEKVCNDCDECLDRCELDPQKVCDNCFRCLEEATRPFAEIPISGIFFDDDFSPEGERPFFVDFEDGFVPDTDESWKAGALLEPKTLLNTYAARPRRRR